MNIPDPDCVFCAIVAGLAPATILRQWEHGIAIVPLNPVTTGHTLIIPRIHVQDACESALTTMRVFELAAYYAKWQGAPGYNIITSIGEVATQTVMHLHVNVVPRREGDALALPWSKNANE
jgi:histidine triad (HIT) family protein